MSYRILFVTLISLAPSAGEVSAQSDYTPKSGSSERQLICDAAREFVLSKYVINPLPQPIVFKIDHMRVQDRYCNFEAIPLFKDGAYVSTKCVPDIAFNFCLKKSGAEWKVVLDLSRTDVPDAAELRTIKRNFSPDFPVSLLSPTWRDLLN